MKILVVSDQHWPAINGIATFGRNLAYGLANRGHQVQVIAPSETGRKYTENDRNHDVRRTVAVPFPFYKNLKISLAPHREVRNIIEDFEPDIIHIQSMISVGRSALRIGKKMGIPVVATNHAMSENMLENLRLLAPFSRPIDLMVRSYAKRFHSGADYVTLPTQAAVDMFAKEIGHLEVRAVSNGVDLSRFKPEKPMPELFAKFGLPTDRPIVSYVGRCDAEKHLSTLVRAFAKIQNETNAHLLVVGSGNDDENLGELAHELKIAQHVTQTGRVSDEDLAVLHRVGTVFAMPSPAELQSISTLEAMASGQPIVAVDAGALRELCQEGKNGFLVPADDVDAMADGLRKVLIDPKLRAKFAKQSLAIAKTHDITYTLETFEEIYESLIK